MKPTIPLTTDEKPTDISLAFWNYFSETTPSYRISLWRSSVEYRGFVDNEVRKVSSAEVTKEGSMLVYSTLRKLASSLLGVPR